NEGSIERAVVNIFDEITEMQKEKLDNMDNDKGIFASQDLLKLAVAYRYVHVHYTDETLNAVELEKFQEQELDLINRMAVFVNIVVAFFNSKIPPSSHLG